MSQPTFHSRKIGFIPLERLALLGFWTLLGIWGALAALTVASSFRSLRVEPACLHGAFLVTTCAVAVVNAGRSLPIQNVAAIACLVGGVGGVAHGVNGFTSIPFGPCVYTLDIGRLVFDFLPWPMPFAWVLFIICSRGTARLILLPWRAHRNYGFILIGLTAALALVLEIGLELFASHVFTYWLWKPTMIGPAWHSVPIVSFIGWFFVTLLILIMATPFLISKSPCPVKPDVAPALLWSATSLVFASAFIKADAIYAGAMQAVTTAAVLTLAIRETVRHRA
jgi:uncharacterized membrane protein